MQMTGRRDYYYWRVLATGGSFVIFGIGGLVLGYLIFPTISLFSRSGELRKRRCRRLVQLSFQFFVWFMAKFGVLTWDLKGQEKLQRSGQLIVANHPTLIDIVFLISMVPNATCIVKSELYKNIFVGGPVRLAGYIPNNESDQLIDDCEAELKSGASLVVFPEGSRTVPEIPLHFKRGAAYLWLRTRCDVSLVTIISSPSTLAKHEKWYQVPPIRPHFSLVADGDFSTFPTDEGERASIGARLLTRHWQDHFKNEMTT